MGDQDRVGCRRPDFPPRICLRGLSQISNTYSPDRIKHPYKRIGERGSGLWQRISWDEATSLIATKFTETQQKYGKKSVWIAPVHRLARPDRGRRGRRLSLRERDRRVGGRLRRRQRGRLATPAGWNYVLVDPANPSNGGGFFTGHESVDFLSAKAIVFWANNVAETSIPDWRVMLDARDSNGAQLISVDPSFTPTSAASDAWLPIRPGSDTALIDGIMNYIFEHKLYDGAYIRSNTVGPYLVDPKTEEVAARQGRDPRCRRRLRRLRRVRQDRQGRRRPVAQVRRAPGDLQRRRREAGTALQALADMVAKYTPEHTEKLTDIPAAQVVSLAKTWGTVKPLGGPRRIRSVALVPRGPAHAGASHSPSHHWQHR